eukprot:TRINITY_DN2940_c0_g1_i1.p1 TRINITY_DN2940_c0_g1~~TRINITY_DN2940_c0_g1_i1.p1  ORF type:complete len:771 (-),score=264.25 TRINITY_DN2940_c0_g1_i1:105-2417(-)
MDEVIHTSNKTLIDADLIHSIIGCNCSNGQSCAVCSSVLCECSAVCDTAALLEALGRMFQSQGNIQKAALCFNKSASKTALLALGKMWISLGRTEDAEDALQRAKALPVVQIQIQKQQQQQQHLDDGVINSLVTTLSTPPQERKQYLLPNVHHHTTPPPTAAGDINITTHDSTTNTSHHRNGETQIEVHDQESRLSPLFLHLSPPSSLSPPLSNTNTTIEGATYNWPISTNGGSPHSSFSIPITSSSSSSNNFFSIGESAQNSHQPTKFIRITHFDKEGRSPFASKIEKESESPVDVHIRAFKLRREFPDSEVEILTVYDNTTPPPRTRPMDSEDKSVQSVRDWLIVALSKLCPGGRLCTPNPLPLDFHCLKVALEQVITHRLYRAHLLELRDKEGCEVCVMSGSITHKRTGYCHYENYGKTNVLESPGSSSPESSPRFRIPTRKNSLPNCGGDVASSPTQSGLTTSSVSHPNNSATSPCSPLSGSVSAANTTTPTKKSSPFFPAPSSPPFTQVSPRMMGNRRRAGIQDVVVSDMRHVAGSGRKMSPPLISDCEIDFLDHKMRHASLSPERIPLSLNERSDNPSASAIFRQKQRRLQRERLNHPHHFSNQQSPVSCSPIFSAPVPCSIAMSDEFLSEDEMEETDSDIVKSSLRDSFDDDEEIEKIDGFHGFSFSADICTVLDKATLRVLEMIDQPESLEDIFSHSSKLFQQIDETDSSCQLPIFSRVFTKNGKELLSIEQVLEHCFSGVCSKDSFTKTTTLVLSEGEDFQ